MSILYGLSEQTYHSDDASIFGEKPNLTASTAKTLIQRSPLHAYLSHPRLGNEPRESTKKMDLGTLVHGLLLGVAGKVAVVECDDWKKKANRELRDKHKAEGSLSVTRALYDEALEVARNLKPKLAARGYPLAGKSEVTVKWTELTGHGEGEIVPCRARFDHLDGANIIDLKITEDANPATIEKQIVRMGYHIQRAAYESGLASAVPEFRGRTSFTLLFCESAPPYCITPVRMSGSLRQLGDMQWGRAVDTWNACLRDNHWPEYTDDVVFAEARPWDLAEEAAA